MYSHTILFILIITCYNSLSDGKAAPNSDIVWPDEYHFKGESIDLKLGFVEAFEIWYSAKQNRSRKDVDGGVVRVYNQGETEDEYEYVYTIHPITTDEELNVDVCIRESHEGGIENYLPKTKGYSYKGRVRYNEFLVSVWEKKVTMEGLDVELTLFVRKTASGITIPVRRILKSFTKWTGGKDTHLVENYYDFHTAFENKTFKYEEETSCQDNMMSAANFEDRILHLRPDHERHVAAAFHMFKSYHTKKYQEHEQEMRKQIFEANWRKVVEHNRKNLGFKLALNEFSDKTPEELKFLTATLPSSPHAVGSIAFPHTDEEVKALASELPESYDMRIEGFMTPVKHQQECGSCWAFSTTAAVEGALSKHYGQRNLDLSEQSLVDCAWGYNNAGCSGGHLDGALKYVEKYGMPTEREYGLYIKQEGLCRRENVTKEYQIKGFAKVTPRNINAMKLALYKYGPVTVAIHASDTMKYYANGIFYDTMCDKEQANHGVTVVGYGVRDDTLYWIVKNSWGESWGEDGYILMSAVNNNCLVLDTPYYPIV